MKCRHDRAKKRQAQREKLHKKQLPVVPVNQERNALCWSPATSPLASIIAPQVDEYAASNMSILGSPLTVDEEKVFESTSPTAVDFDVSSVNWAPRCASPRMHLQDSSFAPEDIWLLEYFIF